MRPTVKYLSSACAGALLLACADSGPRRAPPVPPMQLAGSPDDAYVLGRQQHLANRHPAAIASYQAALRLAPRHVNATNGLATLYAEQGNFPKAIALWRELTDAPGAPLGPGAAFLYSNLGYAYLLNGDYQQAVAVLERACVLDPLNFRAWRHLGSSLEKLGQTERAQLMFKQASAIEQHDIKADYALVKRAAPAVADFGAAAAPSDGWAATEVRRGANGMFELRRTMAPAAAAAMPVPVAAVMPAAAPAPAALEQDQAEPNQPQPNQPQPKQPEPELAVASATVATVEAAADDQVTRLEIRNGNGVTGMARSLARKMSDSNLRVVRLSNEKGFNVEQTRIEYQGGFREAATRLAERFGNATITEVESCNNADMRLVIGRDLVRSKAEARRIIKAALARAAKAG